MRPINDLSKNKDVVIVEPSYNLTDTEIDALRNAIYVTAIQKFLMRYKCSFKIKFVQKHLVNPYIKINKKQPF